MCVHARARAHTHTHTHTPCTHTRAHTHADITEKVIFKKPSECWLKINVFALAQGL